MRNILVKKKMDLRARIIRSDEGAVPISAYTITCVNGPLAKGDVLTYCIAFQEHRHFPPASTEVTIYLCHANQAYQTHEGRPELRIHITPVGAMGLKPRVDGETVFVPSAACDLVYVNHGNKAYLREVYFVVEDCDTSLAADYVGGKIDVTHVPGARPQWRLGTDTSGILHRLFPKNWVPLEPVDPSQPSTVVPVELRPQRHPAWFKFRSTLDGQPLPGLSGKLSGTKWYKMLGKYPGKGFDETPGGFAGNPLTRAGRIMETPVTALYLDYLVKNRPHVQIKECGSFPHPTLVDVMASPDGLIVDPKKTLPGWFQTELRVEYMNDPAALAKIDFTRGVYECKTMATKDKKGDGPLFKEEHMAQLYAEMICTGTFWAEIVRFCHETKEMFVYRVYRKPTIARMFESVIVRMRRDLTEGGKTFAEAANHQDNHTLLHECAKHAVYYNEPRTKDSRRTAIPYDEKVKIPCLDSAANKKKLWRRVSKTPSPFKGVCNGHGCNGALLWDPFAQRSKRVHCHSCCRSNGGRSEKEDDAKRRRRRSSCISRHGYCHQGKDASHWKNAEKGAHCCCCRHSGTEANKKGGRRPFHGRKASATIRVRARSDCGVGSDSIDQHANCARHCKWRLGAHPGKQCV